MFLPIRKGPSFANLEEFHFLKNRNGTKFVNSEGTQLCQSGSVPMLPTRRVLIISIQKGPIFAISEGSTFCQLRRVPIRKIRTYVNSVGYQFCQSGMVSFLPIRKWSNFAKPEGSYFCQLARVQILPIGLVMFLPIRKDPSFAKSEGSQSGRFKILSTR